MKFRPKMKLKQQHIHPSEYFMYVVILQNLLQKQHLFKIQKKKKKEITQNQCLSSKVKISKYNSNALTQISNPKTGPPLCPLPHSNYKKKFLNKKHPVSVYIAFHNIRCETPTYITQHILAKMKQLPYL